MYKPIFTITNNLLSHISQIEAGREIIDNAPLVPAWERKFREEAEDRTVHFSTKIEGNKLDFDESKQVSSGKSIQTFRRRDVVEIINYRDTIEFMNRLKDREIDIDLLLEIHGKVMNNILPRNELGCFRQNEEAVIDAKTYEVIKEFVEPEFVEGEIEELFKWLEAEGKNVHPIIKAGILSYEVVRIHPFVDGNGRTARIVATYSLYKDGYDIKKFFSLEEYYDQNLEEYYKALESVEENDDDLTIWLEFFVKGLADELTRIKNKVLTLSRDLKLKNSVGQVALNDRQIEIISFIETNGFIKNQDWQELFRDVSDDTILRDLKDLIEKDIIKKTGRTKAARYVMK